METRALDRQEIMDRLASRPEWRLEDSRLVREFEFPTFREAVRFVNAIADLAEEKKHHPDMMISYRKVVLSLTTHSAGGITERDMELLAMIDKTV